MKRVAVTGVGAVTPLGLDAPSTWRAALAGESGIGWISTFDTEGLPGARGRRGQGVRPPQVVSAKEARKLERNVLLGVAAGREALDDAALNGFDPARVGVIFGSAIGGVPGDPRAGGHAARARARPGLAELPAERARRLRLRPARDLARDQGPQLRGRLRLRDRLARRRRGGRDDQARRRRRGARRRDRGVHRPADPRRLHRDARARRRGREPGARVAALRRDACRLRDVRGRRRAPARGLGARRAARRARSTPRCSATAPRTTRTTWRSPSPKRPASRR